MSLCACEQNRRKLVRCEGGYWELLSFLSFCRLSLVFWKLSGDMMVLLVVAATATIRAISKQRTNLLHE